MTTLERELTGTTTLEPAADQDPPWNRQPTKTLAGTAISNKTNEPGSS